MRDAKLTAEFTKSQELEKTLDRINDAVSTVKLYDRPRPKYPMLLLMGCPRSGTTLFMQWLSRLGVFGYPSNLVARFYGNPALGCEIQKVLFDFDKENQFLGKKATGGFESSLGRTQGALEPSEFWYFWRRYFAFKDVHCLTKDELRNINPQQLLSELGAMEASLGKPLVMKGMLMNWHIDYLCKILKNAIFVSLKRNPVDVACSILKSRLRYGGDMSKWWSFKPPRYQEWSSLRSEEQVVNQVTSIQSVVDDALSKIPKEQKLEVEYDKFCSNPKVVYEDIAYLMNHHGCFINQSYKGPAQFSARSGSNFIGIDVKGIEESLRSKKERLQ